MGKNLSGYWNNYWYYIITYFIPCNLFHTRTSNTRVLLVVTMYEDIEDFEYEELLDEIAEYLFYDYLLMEHIRRMEVANC